MAGSISRRVQAAATALEIGNYEDCAIHLFPTIDKTAKMSYPEIDKVAHRFKRFIREHQGLITYVATENIFVGGTFGKYSIPEAIYKLGRCPITHEGELDPKLEFSADVILSITDEKWLLNPTFLVGMLTAVILSPTNKKEKISDNAKLILFGTQYRVNDLWGEREKILSSMPFSRHKDSLYQPD